MTIQLYTTNACAYCKMVKRWLDGKKLDYEIINLDEQPEKQKEIFEKSGALTVPVTLVKKDDKEEVIIGFNLPRLASVLAQ